jgi:hypothetical protein
MTNPLDKLGNFVVGQDVLVTTTYEEYLSAITRITDGRGGTIYVKKPKSGVEQAYNQHGNSRGGDGWHTSTIRVPTQEDLNNLKRRQYVQACKEAFLKINFNDIGMPHLKELYEVIKGMPKKS